MDKKELTYDEAMAEIEAILAKFRNEEMSVDALAAEVRRATTLIAFCRKHAWSHAQHQHQREDPCDPFFTHLHTHFLLSVNK